MARVTATTILNIMTRHEQLYRRCCAPVCKQYGVNPSAFDIMLFLANNPKLNTARDICGLLGMKTGIVSVTVEQLIGKKLLIRLPDETDRRIQRLFLTKEADPLIAAGQAAQEQYEASLASGLTEAELAEFIRLCRKLWTHMGEMLKQKP